MRQKLREMILLIKIYKTLCYKSHKNHHFGIRKKDIFSNIIRFYLPHRFRYAQKIIFTQSCTMFDSDSVGDVHFFSCFEFSSWLKPTPLTLPLSCVPKKAHNKI